jgi:hypothetical protein
MRKLLTCFIFILLSGLFAGVFFGVGFQEETRDMLFGSIDTTDAPAYAETNISVLRLWKSLFVSNMLLTLMMLPVLITKYLCSLPCIILWFKTFAIGVCTGLIYTSCDNVLEGVLMCLSRMLPQNIFVLPAFLAIAMTTFHLSRHKKSREHPLGISPLIIYSICIIIICIGCIIQGLILLIAL